MKLWSQVVQACDHPNCWCSGGGDPPHQDWVEGIEKRVGTAVAWGRLAMAIVAGIGVLGGLWASF